ncbi:MAG: carbohydrate binding domain-containing protein [Armatimonadota bacterium]
MALSRLLFLCLALLVAGLVSAAEADFRLREFLGHEWTNERVTFPLTEKQYELATKNRKLIADQAINELPYRIVAGPLQGGEVPYQILKGTPPRIVFCANLKPFETRGYYFTNEPGTLTSTAPLPMRITETAESITLTNHIVAIKLAKSLDGGKGPIAGIMPRNEWIGSSIWNSEQPVTEYQVEITEYGYVFAEVICRAKLADGSAWAMRVQVIAGDPVILFDEKSSIAGKKSFWRLSLDGFNPDSLLYRYGKQDSGVGVGKNAAWKIEKGEVFRLEPWLHWWERVRQGPVCSLYAEGGKDMLTIGAREAGAWVDPGKTWEQQPRPQLALIKDDAGLHMDLPLMTNQRKWMIAAPDQETSLAVLKEEKLAFSSPLPHRLLIKYGHFSLDQIKDYTLTWPAGDLAPHIFLSKADLAKFRARKDLDTFTKQIPGLLNNPLNVQEMDVPISAYLASGDAKLGRKLADSALAWMQDAVNMFLDQPYAPYGGGPAQHSNIPLAATAADVVMGTDLLTPEQRERLLAQAAFLGYALNRPDFWNGERGYAANPNMTTSIDGYRVTLAAFLPTHPLAKTWAKDALTELKEQVDTWSDSNGGWLEAPHYAMVSYDPILACYLMARNAGYDGYLDEGRLKKIMSWFGKIATPPDSRIGGFRHLPPIGNTYLNEPTGEFGVVAGIWKDKDPEFAAHMQYMYQQFNKYAQPGIGGAYPALSAYRRLLLDPDIPAKAPAWGSELFPETGVVLRNTFPSDRETQLYMIAGYNHLHYDQDSGAITLYGKGRVLIDDFGYYGNVPPEDHNVLESPVAANGGVMRVQQFYTKPAYDYIRGLNAAWTRQVTFVKDADPLAPNYFVLNDELLIPAPATWRLWCTANTVTPTEEGALVEGKEDVDMDVIVVRPEGGVTFTTEARTRRSVSGLFPNWNWGPMDSTQHGVLAALPKSKGLMTVLYPRLKTEGPPTVIPLADGKGVKVITAKGLDYIFQSAKPFTYAEEGLEFEGTAGLVQVRAKAQPVLALGSAGKLTFRGKTITSTDAIPKASTNLFTNGDFEDGTLNPFVEDAAGLKFRINKGNPVAEDKAHAGKYCLAFDFPQKYRTAFSANKTLYVDASHTYRISMDMHITGPIMVEVGGYGSDGKNVNLKTAAGGTWQYGFNHKGPTPGWITKHITVGPAGSGADLTFPEGILSTHMTCWVTADAPGTVYWDNIAFEDLTPEK